MPKRWTKKEIKILLSLVEQEKSMDHMEKELGRNYQSIYKKLYSLKYYAKTVFRKR